MPGNILAEMKEMILKEKFKLNEFFLPSKIISYFINLYLLKMTHFFSHDKYRSKFVQKIIKKLLDHIGKFFLFLKL